MSPPPRVPPWWRGYFDDTFFRLNRPFFPEADSRREAGAMLELLGLPAGARILDVPCGWGRHTLLLPAASVRAFGADLSPQLLRRGADAALEAGLPRRFAAGDLRELPFRDGAFDAVVNVFTSLGLFADDREDVRALREARRLLCPGGKFLLETMHRDDVVCAFARRDRWTLPDGTEVRVRRRFDPVTGISHERLRWRRPVAAASPGEPPRYEEGEKRHALRLRTATEIDGLLSAAGFGRRAWYGDWDGEPFTHESPRLIVVAEAGG